MHPGLAKGRKMPPKEAWAWAALEEAAGMERRAAAWNSAGDARRPENRMVHGWVTPRERRLLRARLGAFAARALR